MCLQEKDGDLWFSKNRRANCKVDMKSKEKRLRAIVLIMYKKNKTHDTENQRKSLYLNEMDTALTGGVIQLLSALFSRLKNDYSNFLPAAFGR